MIASQLLHPYPHPPILLRNDGTLILSSAFSTLNTGQRPGDLTNTDALRNIRASVKIKNPNMEVNDSRIHNFWYLFEEIAKEIVADSNSSEIVEYVDSLVRSIGDYDWEFGPSMSRSFYFALSPNMRIDLLDQVDYIVSLAPNIDGWEIISCKPKKPEHVDEWEMLNEKGEKITINTANWKCVIYEFPDGTVDMDIVLDNVNGNDETKYFAVDIHLCNILGERKYIQRVNAIYIVEQFESDVKNRSVFVNDLDNYI